MLSLARRSLAVGVLGLLIHGGSAARAADTMDLRRAVGPNYMHTTKLANLKPAFSVTNGSDVTLYVQVLYEKKAGGWAPLTDKSVPVEFKLGNQLQSAMTNQATGYAYCTFKKFTAGNHIPARGVRVNWHAAYKGDGTTFKASLNKYESITINP